MRNASILFAVYCVIALPVHLHAEELNQRQAREAVERGELRPLSEILESIRKEFSGKVLDVELEREDSGALVYEVEILTEGGRVLELEYDGRTGRRLSIEDDDD